MIEQQQGILLDHQPILVAECIHGEYYGIVWTAVLVDPGNPHYGSAEIAGRPCSVFQVHHGIENCSWVQYQWLDEGTGQ